MSSCEAARKINTVHGSKKVHIKEHEWLVEIETKDYRHVLKDRKINEKYK